MYLPKLRAITEAHIHLAASMTDMESSCLYLQRIAGADDERPRLYSVGDFNWRGAPVVLREIIIRMWLAEEWSVNEPARS